MRRCLLTVLLACTIGKTAMADDERLASLSPENQAVAGRMVEFMGRMDEKYFGRAKQLNHELKFEELSQTTETDDYEVRVTRGPVVEKLGRMIAAGKKTPPGRVQKELAWGRFYSLDFHPRTPLVGMLHAVTVLQIYADGTGFAGGWLGVMNGTRVEADMAQLKGITDGYFKAHGKDSTLYRKLIMKGTDDTVGKWRRRPDDSGVSFYGPPVDPYVTKAWEFVSGLFDPFVDGYVDLIAKHAKDRGNEQDIRAQDEMRKRWLNDQLFSDPFSSKLVPYEVWSLSNVPPVIKY
jgi:hypothetical protein